MDLMTGVPQARREPTRVELHGQVLEDDFGWMREKGSPEVIAYLEAENAYTAEAMRGTGDDAGGALCRDALAHQGDG